MKVCARCKKEKSLNEFNARSDYPKRCRSHCKQCVSIAAKANYEKNKKIKPPKAVKRNLKPIRTVEDELAVKNYLLRVKWKKKPKTKRAMNLRKNKLLTKEEKLKKLAAKAAKYRKEHPDRIRKTKSKQKENLTDGYVAKSLTNNSDLKPSEVPAELIELHRIRMKIKRHMKSI